MASSSVKPAATRRPPSPGGGRMDDPSPSPVDTTPPAGREGGERTTDCTDRTTVSGGEGLTWVGGRALQSRDRVRVLKESKCGKTATGYASSMLGKTNMSIIFCLLPLGKHRGSLCLFNVHEIVFKL